MVDGGIEVVSTPGPSRGGRRITKGTKVREHEKGAGVSAGGDLRSRGPRRPVGCPRSAPNKELFVVGDGKREPGIEHG